MSKKPFDRRIAMLGVVIALALAFLGFRMATSDPPTPPVTVDANQAAPPQVLPESATKVNQAAN